MTNKSKGLSINVLRIADYFIYKSNFDDNHSSTISPLKLQKLIYYAQAWNSVFHDGKRLFDDEIEAWVHGPVVPSVYREYKQYGYNDITRKITNIPSEIDNEPKIKNVLEAVWNMYGELDAKTLEKLTHSEIPWQEARKGLHAYEPSKNKISLNTMTEYYKKYLN